MHTIHTITHTQHTYTYTYTQSRIQDDVIRDFYVHTHERRRKKKSRNFLITKLDPIKTRPHFRGNESSNHVTGFTLQMSDMRRIRFDWARQCVIERRI